MPFMYIRESVTDPCMSAARGTWIAGSPSTTTVRVRSTHATDSPVRLLYAEEDDRVEDAFLREKQVQRWGRSKRLALVKGCLGKLRPLGKKINWRRDD